MSQRFRAHARQLVRLKATLLHSGSGWERDVAITDLGFGGACLDLDEALQVGDRVTLAFDSPSLWDPLLVGGHVVWSLRPPEPMKAARVGIRFEYAHPQAAFAVFEMLGSLDYEG